MEKIIITDTPDDFEYLGDQVNIINILDFNSTPPPTWNLYLTEYNPFKICESIGSGDFLIGIDFSISQHIDKYLIAYHLIISQKGIVFFFSDDNAISLHLEDDRGLFRNKAIVVIDKEKLNNLIKEDELASSFKNIYTDNFDLSYFIENFHKFQIIDRHQITNEWGATKLLLNHGLSLVDIESGYELPKTTYFKIKLREHSIDHRSTVDVTGYYKATELITQKTRFIQTVTLINSILLIDDNANNGWEFALKKIFTSANIETKLSFEECSTITDFSIYDLIFVDLRLPTNNSTDKAPNIHNGFQLIERIKNDANFLHVPLIVFTASQKASTLNDIIEEGADAMYVKESPELSPNESLDNYLKFLTDVNYQIEKGRNLKKYWTVIQIIKNSLLPEVSNFPPVILKDRIIERLEMFYGLLKKKYEQSSYNDTRFHFSSDVLSFITLWSILNEIQECYFDKGLGQSYTTIRDYSTTPYTYITINLDNWKVKNQTPEKFFIVEKPIITEDINSIGGRQRPNKDHIRKELYSNFQISKIPPFFEFDSTGFNHRRVNYKERLSLQIAFLIMAKDALKSSTNLNSYLMILKEANEQRNKLYITHGEDADTSFHTLLEKDKVLPANMTYDLFRLITFLLTGDDSII